MKKTARNASLDAGQQMLFEYRRTIAERTAAGELTDVSHIAKSAGFRWPLAVSAKLREHVQTIPHGCTRNETVDARWQHIFLLAATAAAQVIRNRLSELKINVVLRTSAAPEKSREHFKALRLTVERDSEGCESFSLGYPDEK
jgi:hypothetical protein